MQSASKCDHALKIILIVLNPKRLFIFILLFIFKSSFSQKFTFPVINKVGTEIQDFTPIGWRISDSVRGDLNGNRLNDYAIILTYRDSVQLTIKEENRNVNIKACPRILVILLYDTSDKKLILSDQNNKIIPPLGIDEYQFNSVEIDNGVLKLDVVIFFGPAAHETVSYTFRHQNEKTVCIGVDTDYFNEATRGYETCSFNFLTRRWWISKGEDGDSESRNSKVWHVINIRKLRPLSLFQEPLTWNVTKGKTL